MNKTPLIFLFCILALTIFACSPQHLPAQETPTPTVSPTSEQTPTPAALTRTVCAGGNLNLRSDANAKAAILGTLQDGESLEPVSTASSNALSLRATTDGGKWLEVRVKSMRGWVNSRYLCPTPTPELP